MHHLGREVLRGVDRVPRSVGGDALYLDFDGVLHHHDVIVCRKRGTCFGEAALASGRQHTLFEHQEILVDLLKPYDSIRIVLSTTWARKDGFSSARNRLCQALSTRVVGSTFHSGCDREAFKQASRGMQVWGDVCRRKPGRWLALDDDSFGWPAWCRDRLVVSDPVHGLSSPATSADLSRKLQEMFSHG